MTDKRMHFSCDCHEPFHQFIVDYDPEDGDVVIYIQLKHFMGFWERLVNAFKYVTGWTSRRYEYSEVFLYKDETIIALRDHLTAILEDRNKTSNNLEKGVDFIN